MLKLISKQTIFGNALFYKETRKTSKPTRATEAVLAKFGNLTFSAEQKDKKNVIVVTDKNGNKYVCSQISYSYFSGNKHNLILATYDDLHSFPVFIYDPENDEIYIYNKANDTFISKDGAEYIYDEEERYFVEKSKYNDAEKTRKASIKALEKPTISSEIPVVDSGKNTGIVGRVLDMSHLSNDFANNSHFSSRRFSEDYIPSYGYPYYVGNIFSNKKPENFDNISLRGGVYITKTTHTNVRVEHYNEVVDDIYNEITTSKQECEETVHFGNANEEIKVIAYDTENDASYIDNFAIIAYDPEKDVTTIKLFKCKTFTQRDYNRKEQLCYEYEEVYNHSYQGKVADNQICDLIRQSEVDYKKQKNDSFLDNIFKEMLAAGMTKEEIIAWLENYKEENTSAKIKTTKKDSKEDPTNDNKGPTFD